jgi:flagellar motor switch protein FliG
VSTALRGRGAEPLSGLQKAAVLCVALGSERASRVFQHLTPEEVESVAREIIALPPVPQETVQGVLRDYQAAAREAESVAHGGPSYAQQVLEQALGQTRARAALDQLRAGAVDTGLKRLKRAAPEVLVGILRGEHPQTIALILAHLDVRHAAGLVATMERELAADVLHRVARMEKIAPEMLAVVEAGLSSKTDLTLSQEMTLSGGPASVAKLLNLAGATLERELLDRMGQSNPELAAEISALMFTFEDLLLVDKKGIQRLLRDLDTKELALALKAASHELKKHIFSAMSERAGAAVEEEMEILGPVRVKDVEACHGRIVETLRGLEQAGELMIRSRGADDDIIE